MREEPSEFLIVINNMTTDDNIRILLTPCILPVPDWS